MVQRIAVGCILLSFKFIYEDVRDQFHEVVVVFGSCIILIDEGITIILRLLQHVKLSMLSIPESLLDHALRRMLAESQSRDFMVKFQILSNFWVSPPQFFDYTCLIHQLELHLPSHLSRNIEYVLIYRLLCST